ncbi:MAG: restriction endonuclease subunit S, partial [Phascolarctobacterium sp.]|nr:restriction endonuclease subunit S [Phascolarctobacterium sp.]
MRAMKDSGVEWIGEIPQDWEVVRLKSCFCSRAGGAWGEEPTGENDAICLRIADFDYSRLSFKKCSESSFTKRHYTEKQIAELMLKKNDLLIEKSGGGEKVPVGRVVIFDKEFTALYANFMDRLRCSDFIHPRYMLYILTAFYQNGFVWNYIKQTTGIQNLDITSMLFKEKVMFPDIEVQNEIVSYLDSKCSKIDSIIEKQQAVIEKLKEYKLSVITEAVTKGLNHDVEMKDSGVEWIGEVPKTTTVTRAG